MNRFFILVLLLLAVSSCSKESVEPTDQNIEPSFSITVALPGVETRLESHTDDDNSWTFSWENGDAMGNWHTGCTTLQEFVNKKATGETASFSGDLGAGENHRFIFPYDSDDTKIISGEKYAIDISSQDGTLGNTLFITDKVYTREELTDGTITVLPMEHVGGFMVVDITLNQFVVGKTYTLKGVKYSSDDDIIYTEAVLDLTKEYNDNDIYSSLIAGEISAEVDVPFSKDGDYLNAVTRLNILPFTFEIGQSITVELTIEISEGEEENKILLETLTSEVTFSNNGSVDLPFNRATHNFTKLTVDGSYGIEITGAQINDWDTVPSGELSTAQIIESASEISSDN